MLRCVQRVFDIRLSAAAFAIDGGHIDRGRLSIEMTQSTNSGSLRVLFIHPHESLRLLGRLAGFERRSGGGELPGVFGCIARQDVERQAIRFNLRAVAAHHAAGAAVNDIVAGRMENDKFVEIPFHRYRVRRVQHRLGLR